MKKAEASKMTGMVASSKLGLDALKRRDQKIHQPAGKGRMGTAIVQTVIAMGADCACTINVIEKGRPSGLSYQHARCYGARLKPGQTVSYMLRDDGTVEIVSGGGSAAAGTTTVNTLLVPHSHQGPSDGGWPGGQEGTL